MLKYLFRDQGRRYWVSTRESHDYQNQSLAYRYRQQSRPLPTLTGRASWATSATWAITSVKGVDSGRIFLLDGPLSREQATRIAAELLADPVCEQFQVHAEGEPLPAPAGSATVEVYFKTGVMDPVALSTQTAIGDMKLQAGVRTGKRYVIAPAPDDKTIQLIVRRVLTNGSIEDAIVGCRPAGPAPEPRPYQFKLRTVKLLGLDDKGLAELSRQGHLFLSVEEMKAIQDHYKAAGRDPTDIELEMFAQTWSEHCCHKTFKSAVTYTGEPMPAGPGTADTGDTARSCAGGVPICQSSEGHRCRRHAQVE